MIQTAEENELGQLARHQYFTQELERHHDSARRDGDGRIKTELSPVVPLPRERGKPSRWRERRAEENARLARQQGVKKEPVKETQDTGATPKRKPGRPVGWKKDMGLSYGDFTRKYGPSD